MSDLENGTAAEQPADDIRSTLADALAQSEAPPAGEAAAPAKDGAADTSQSDDAGGARVRGADGKFLKKDEAKPDPADAATAGKEQPDPDTQQAQATDVKEAPVHWSQADKDKFKAQPPEAQAFILDRVKAMEGDYTRKTQEIAGFKKEYGPVDEMFAPHRDAMRQKGFTPKSLIEAWANVEKQLASGPDQAVQVVRGLVQGYGIPTEKIAAALGITSQPAPARAAQEPTAVENGQAVQLPPEIANELKTLREQVGQFGQKFQTIEQRDRAFQMSQQQAEEAAVQKHVDDFRSSKDEKGSLLYPHFDDVEGLMTSLANAALASKQPVPPLKELYETAVYANPATREKVLTAQRQQEEAKRVGEAKAKAASARRAGSSVQGAPGSGQAPPSGKSGTELSLREALEAAADEAA
jgi:hypothetical protein